MCTFSQFNLSKDCIFWTYVLKSVHNKKSAFLDLCLTKNALFYYVNNLYWYFHMYIFISNIITAHSIWWKCSYKLKQWYFVTKIVLIYHEKKLFQWSRKTFEIWGWRPRIFKKIEITRTIGSNSERSQQFLVTKWFFDLFLEVSQV